jgi:uncharacterized protein
VTEAALVVAGAGLGLAAAGWAAGRLFHHALLRGLRAPRVPHDPVGPSTALQALRLATGQGKQLAAWLAWPVPRPAGPVPAVLVMHGWGANASMMASVVAPLQAAGMAVLLVDARCHGDSDGERFTSMPRFAEDIATGLGWLRTQAAIDGQRLALLGHSVGAAAALLHVAGLGGQGGDGEVRAVVSLSAFAHPQEVMRRWLAEHRLPYPVLGWAVLRHVQRVIGARFDDIAPLHTLARLHCPVLLVHGRDDRTVPFDDARRLLQVARHGRLLAVAGDHDLRDALAPHAGEIVAFLQGALAQRGPALRLPAQPPPTAGPAGFLAARPAAVPSGRRPEPPSIRR